MLSYILHEATFICAFSSVFVYSSVCTTDHINVNVPLCRLFGSTVFKFRWDEREILACERQDSLSLLAGPEPQKHSGSLLPRCTVTKYFSHASWALAGRQVKDGDVTESVNREGSIAPFPDGTFRPGFVYPTCSPSNKQAVGKLMKQSQEIYKTYFIVITSQTSKCEWWLVPFKCLLRRTDIDWTTLLTTCRATLTYVGSLGMGLQSFQRSLRQTDPNP